MGVQLPSAQNVGVASTAQDPGLNVSGAAFGTLEGGGLEALGGVGVDVVDRYASREEATARSKARLNINRRVTERYREINDKEDWAEKGVSDQFAADVDAIVTEETEAAGGRWGSQERLLAQAEEIKQGWIATAATDVARRKVEIAEEARDDQVNSLVAMIDADPSQASLDDAIERVDTEIMPDLAPLIPAGAETEQRKAIVGMLVTAAANRHLMIGDTEGATAVLDQYALKGEIDTLQHLRTRNAITVAAYQKNEDQRRLNQRIETFMAGGFSKRDATMMAAGFAPPKGRDFLTMPEAVGNFREIFGREPNDQEMEGLARNVASQIMDAPGGMFGNSKQGLAAQRMLDLYPVISSGNQTAEQDREWQVAMGLYQSPETNPITGMQTVLPMQPFMEMGEAMRTASIGMLASPEPSAMTQMAAAPAPATAPPTAPPQPAAVPTAPPMAATAVPGTIPGPPPAVAQAPRPPNEPARTPTGAETIFDLVNSGLVAGPGPAIGRAAQSIPVVSDFVPDVAARMTGAERRVQLATTDLVTRLQNSPRYAEGERTLIREIVSLEPKFVDDAEAALARMKAVEEHLIARAATAEKMLAPGAPDVSLEFRRHQADVLAGIEQFRAELGLPPRFLKPSEVTQAIHEGRLSPGDMFFDVDYQLRVAG